MQTKTSGSSGTPSKRTRRDRLRRRSGIRIFNIRVTDTRVDALVAKKYLEANERADMNAVQAAIEAFIENELGALSGWSKR
ncbi:MAG: hypothetical protein ABSA68_11775 [Xanthobacteraceae bacterium]|jgi:hypothetical protein